MRNDIEIRFRDLPLKVRLMLIAADTAFGLMMLISMLALFGIDLI